MTDHTPNYEELLAVAKEVAMNAGEVAMQYWRTEVGSDTSGTKSSQRDLVTHADKQADAAARAVIEQHFPEHGIITEEDENKDITQEYVWTVDPIDGTVNYTMGLPTFGSIVGVMRNGEPVVGVCWFPALDELYWAVPGGGAWMVRGHEKPVQLQVSDISSLEEARFAVCSGYLDRYHTQLAEDYMPKLLLNTNAARIHFAGAWDMMNIARGGEDFYINIGDNPNVWDYAASLIIVQEAGGAIHNVAGKPVTLEMDPDPENPIGNVIVHNGKIVDAVVELLNSK